MAIHLKSVSTKTRHSGPFKTPTISTNRATHEAGDSESAEIDSVSLTAMGINLQQAEQLLSLVPVVNAPHVIDVVQALNNGGYEINSEQVADKIIRLEQQLSGQIIQR